MVPNGIITYNQNPNPNFESGTLATLTCDEGTSTPISPTDPRPPPRMLILECVEIIPGGGGVFVPNGTMSQVELECSGL